MLDHIITHAWQASTCNLNTCRVTLPQDYLTHFDEAIHELNTQDRPLETFRIQEYNHSELRTAFQPIVKALEKGTGFAIVDRLPLDQYSLRETELIFWLLGQLVGPPYRQNAGGSVLYNVRDEGQDVHKGARFSVTNLELTYHTDNARSTVVPDYVALLCIHPAKSGGVSYLVNGYAVHNELLQHYPDELATLYQPFYFDRRGLNLQDEPEISQFPIFQWNGQELLCRFIRLYMEVAHEKIGEPLIPDQIRALDTFQATVEDPRFRAEFTLKRGEMLFTNNHWILHNRTAFEDHEDPVRKRHLLRLWLARENRA